MKRVTSESVAVRRNPGYNPNLTKDWLVLNAGTCVGEFDRESEANAYRDKVLGELPKRVESDLSPLQELKNAYRSTPKKEIKKRRQIKAEVALLRTQEGQAKEKGKTKHVEKEVETKTEVKAKTYHYHKGRRGRCNCETSNSEVK